MAPRSFGLARRSVTDKPVDEFVTIQRDISADSGPVVGDLFSPRAGADGSVIVTVHGCCGTRHDLTQYALALSEAGASVFNVSWRCIRTGDSFHESLSDLRSAVASARLRFGGRVTLAAWSDGALPAAVLALGGNPSDHGTPDSFAGLGGFYGWRGAHVPSWMVNARTVAYFGGTPEDEPGMWSRGNPHEYVRNDAVTPIALLVGERDLMLADAKRFSDALRLAGHSAELEILSECDHSSVVIPRVPPGRRSVERLVVFASGVDR